MMPRNRARGFTLIEITIAISLLAMLSVGMLVALRVGLNAQLKANTKLMENRRVVGAQRALEQQIAGFMPEMAVWTNPNGGTLTVPFFGGDPRTMRFVSSYSLNEASRGRPQLLEFAVIPGDADAGVRLIVNELPYRGGLSAGARIAGIEPDENGIIHPAFFPVVPGPWSFVLADRLAYCHFLYLEDVRQPVPHQEWRLGWVKKEWPRAVRLEMAPLDVAPGQLHPMTITLPLRAYRDPDMKYVD